MMDEKRVMNLLACRSLNISRIHLEDRRKEERLSRFRLEDLRNQLIAIMVLLSGFTVAIIFLYSISRYEFLIFPIILSILVLVAYALIVKEYKNVSAELTEKVQITISTYGYYEKVSEAYKKYEAGSIAGDAFTSCVGFEKELRLVTEKHMGYLKSLKLSEKSLGAELWAVDQLYRTPDSNYFEVEVSVSGNAKPGADSKPKETDPAVVFPEEELAEARTSKMKIQGGCI